VLATMGAGLLYVQGPAIDQMLPAFALALAVLGTGVAAGGWLLGWTSEHLPPSATALRSLGVAGAVGVAALPLATGVLMAFSAAEDAGAAIPRTRARPAPSRRPQPVGQPAPAAHLPRPGGDDGEAVRPLWHELHRGGIYALRAAP
jgi:hypothetical protein